MDTSRSLPTPTRPLVPSDLSARHALVRAAFAKFVGAARPFVDDVESILRSLFPRDAVAAGVLAKVAVGSARTDTPGWAAELVGTAVSAFVGALMPQSAASTLIAQGTRVDLAADAIIRVPGVVSVPPAGYVGEGQPIPLMTAPFDGPELTPGKVAVIILLSREIARYGVGGLPVFEQILREVASASLDAAYFSENPPGLLAGVTPLPPSSDIANDLARLAEVVSLNGSGQVVYVAAAGIAAGIMARYPEFRGTVLPSAALPPGRIVGLDPLSIIHATDPVPLIDASEESTVHADDAPDQISTPGSPSTVAAPTYSLFQSGRVGLRMILGVGFVARRSDAVAYMDTAGGWWPATLARRNGR